MSCERPTGIPLQSLPGPRSSSGVEAGTSGFLSSADMDFGVPLEFQQWSQSSSGSDMVSDMQVRFPLELSKYCQVPGSCPGGSREFEGETKLVGKNLFI